MRFSSTRRKWTAVAAGSALALLLTACGDDGAAPPAGGGGGTLVFGASADPVILDGALISDGESLRPIIQIFETLVGTEPGGTEIVPALAESWSPTPDGLDWTFNLRKGVKFHDGEPFNAAAVCANFERWYNFTGLMQSSSVSYYWQTVFGGYKANNPDSTLGQSLYSGCQAKDESTAVITLTKPSSTFLSAMSINTFSIASPKALTDYKADEVTGTEDAPVFTGSFGYEHPIGTGPFKFESWTRGDKLTLVRNDDYWGTKAKLAKLIFRPIADGPARRQALEAGSIDAYDLVDPADIDALKGQGIQILNRPAFNIGYIGFNQAKPPMDNLKIRQAIAYAINRQNIVMTNYPAGAEVATQFQPPQLFGWAEDVKKYDYNVDMAKQLIAESGIANPTIEFWYPSDVSRPYMPDPAANFELMKADLEAAGFTVKPMTAPWRPDYLDKNAAGEQMMYLLGWTGDYGDPDNFIGTFFQQTLPDFAWDDQKVRDDLSAAEEEPDQNKRIDMYKAINRYIAEQLPGLPYVHTQPSVAFKAGITGYVPGPLNNESFAPVTKG